MEITFLSYFLASVIAYLGLFAGLVLVKMAPEEQKPGRKYFILLKKLLFLAILAFPLHYFKVNILVSFGLLSFAVGLMLVNKLGLSKSYMVYFLFGIIFSISARFVELLVLESIMIFLYGMPNASLALSLKKKNYHEVFAKNLLFFIPVVLYPLF